VFGMNCTRDYEDFEDERKIDKVLLTFCFLFFSLAGYALTHLLRF
jgi:hypothetical protein